MRLGLLAGGGRFPLYVAESVRRQGIEVVCVAIRDHADAPFAGAVDRLHWCGLAGLGAMIRNFRAGRVDAVVMAGKIHKVAMFSPWRAIRTAPDWRGIRVFFSRKRRDNKDDSMILHVIDEFEREGLPVMSALDFCPELLAQPGVLSKQVPTERQRRDIAFGWRLAREMGRLDVGQSVAVKESAVLAVEAIEGTDQAIARAGTLCGRGGFVVVKVAKPEQDPRFDVPTVGVSTIESLAKAGGSVLAIEAGRTILMDPEETVALANRHGIRFLALTDAEALSAAA